MSFLVFLKGLFEHKPYIKSKPLKNRIFRHPKPRYRL